MTDAREDEDALRFASLDDGDGPAVPLSTDAADALVRGVLDAALPPAGSGGAPSGSGGITAGKVVLGVATIALVTGGVVWSLRTPPAIRPTEPTPVASAPAEPAAPIEVTEVVPLPETPDAALREPEVAPAYPDASVVAFAPEESVADLLAEANRLRRSGDYAEAEATYQRVVQTNPRAREAHVARVAAAGLRLERLDDAAGAARLYRDAARGSGALAAEATFGLARAARELGDTPAETQALRSIVERYPSSPYVRLAVERLRTLGITVTPSTEAE